MFLYTRYLCSRAHDIVYCIQIVFKTRKMFYKSINSFVGQYEFILSKMPGTAYKLQLRLIFC